MDDRKENKKNLFLVHRKKVKHIPMSRYIEQNIQDSLSEINNLIHSTNNNIENELENQSKLLYYANKGDIDMDEQIHLLSSENKECLFLEDIVKIFKCYFPNQEEKGIIESLDKTSMDFSKTYEYLKNPINLKGEKIN
jgi:hypothetical protein